MHHKRVVQEKNKLIDNIKRLKKHVSTFEPTLGELRHKYEVAMKVCRSPAACTCVTDPQGSRSGQGRSCRLTHRASLTGENAHPPGARPSVGAGEPAPQ